MKTRSSTLWTELAPELRERLGADRYERWVAPLSVLADGEGELKLGAPNRFWLEWIEDRYLKDIASAVERKVGAAVRVTLAIDPELYCRLRRQQREVMAGVSGGTEQVGLAAASGVSGGLPLLPAPGAGMPSAGPEAGGQGGEVQTLENFVVGMSNRMAFTAARRVVESGEVLYNPLYIHGSSGVGKTHLLRAICHGLKMRKPAVATRFLTGECFLNQFVDSLRAGTIGRFREAQRAPRVTLIDDIQLLGNKVRTQEEFLHTFNTLADSGQQIVITSDCHPSTIENLQKGLLGRFISGLVVEVGRPDFDTRLEIVRRRAGRARVAFRDDVLAVLAESVRRSVRDLIGAQNLLEANAVDEGAPLSPERAQEILARLPGQCERRVSQARIAQRVARHFGVSVEALASCRRHRSLSLARQVAMYLSRKYTERSLAEIGQFFGDRNHTSVKSAESKVQRLLQKNPVLAKDLEMIIDSFQD
jgi:chromosomal replication initiator protein